MKSPSKHVSILISMFIMIISFLPDFSVTAYAQDPDSTNCMLTPIHLRGNRAPDDEASSEKRLYAKFLADLVLRHSPYPGAVGETVESFQDAFDLDTNNGAQYPPAVANDPSLLGGASGFASTLSASGFSVGSDYVAILVLDDFSHMPAHGWIVYDFLTRLAQSVQGSASRIHIEPVNIADPNVGLLSGALVPVVEDSINQLRRFGYRRFILNMSFALAPCDQLNFEEFLAQHNEDPTYSLIDHLGGEEAVISALAFTGLDTFAEYVVNNELVSSGEIDTLIPVASAGNFAQPEPFFPAHYDGFISVSASVADFAPAIPWPMSNAGDVMAPGAWFELTDSHLHAGTSLAAPVVSMLLALDQSSGSPKCAVASSAPALQSTALSAGNPFQNVPVGDAVNGC